MPSVQLPFHPFSISRLVGHLLSAAVVILLLAMAAPQAAGIYQWKDAEGNVHYGDSPPPGVAMPSSPSYPSEDGTDADGAAQQAALAKRFAEACRDDVESSTCRQLRREASEELQKDCAPEWQGTPCKSVQDDYVAGLAQQIAAFDPVAEAARDAVLEARVAELKADDCRQQRNQLEALQKMEQDLSGDMLSADERARLPAEIERLEARLAAGCS